MHTCSFYRCRNGLVRPMFGRNSCLISVPFLALRYPCEFTDMVVFGDPFLRWQKISLVRWFWIFFPSELIGLLGPLGIGFTRPSYSYMPGNICPSVSISWKRLSLPLGNLGNQSTSTPTWLGHHQRQNFSISAIMVWWYQHWIGFSPN